MSLIQIVAYYFVVPVIYLLIILFDFNLVRRAEVQTERISMLLGIIGGILISVVVLLLDQLVDFSTSLSALADPRSIEMIWPYVIVSLLAGGMLVFGIHALLKKRVLSFLVMLTIALVIVSLYFLITLSNLRGVFAVSSISFLVGIILYLMINPGILPMLIIGISAEQDVDDTDYDAENW